jgi:hypothetical protein
MRLFSDVKTLSICKNTVYNESLNLRRNVYEVGNTEYLVRMESFNKLQLRGIEGIFRRQELRHHRKNNSAMFCRYGTD